MSQKSNLNKLADMHFKLSIVLLVCCAVISVLGVLIVLNKVGMDTTFLKITSTISVTLVLWTLTSTLGSTMHVNELKRLKLEIELGGGQDEKG